MLNTPHPGKPSTDRSPTGSPRLGDRNWKLGSPPSASATASEVQQSFGNIIQSSPMGMQFFTLGSDDRLVLTAANTAADSILDIKHAQLIGLSIEEAFPVLASTEVPAKYRHIAKHGGSWRTQHIRSDARQVRQAYEVHVFTTGPGQLVTMFFDITRRIRAEAEVTAWKQRYELVASTSGEIVYDYNLSTGEILWSGSLTKVLGYEAAELNGGIEQWRDCIHPEDRAEAVRKLESSATAAAPYDVEYRFLHKGGLYRLIHDRGSFLIDAGGNSIRMTGMMRDITDHRRMEENLLQAQKMEAIGRLAGGIAHDFNNILTAILGFNERMLTQIPNDSPLHLHAIEIGKAAQRAAALTQQLLAFGRKQVLQPRLFNLNELILDYEAMLARVIGSNIEFVVDLAPSLRAVKIDRGQLGQILMNLAINARDAMADGGRLQISTANVTLGNDFIQSHPDIRPGQYVRLEVADTGHGFNEETKARLFEPFFTTKDPDKGTGLGLASTYGIIRQNNGHLILESELQRGSTFSIYLPVVEGDVEVASAAPLHDVQLPRGTETILVAEDELPVCEFVKLVLEELGYTVLAAANGEEAIQLARQHGSQSIQLLFTDVVMPRMSGKELADLLRAERPSLKVIFASGYTRDVFGPNSNLPEDVTFLQKPYTSTVLANTIRQVLDAKPKR